MRHSFDLVGTFPEEVRAWCKANLLRGFVVKEIAPDVLSDDGFINIGPELAGQLTIGFVVDGPGPEFTGAWKPGHARVSVLIEDSVEALRFARRWCKSHRHRKASIVAALTPALARHRRGAPGP
jgi:hypothetical protein